MPIPKIVVTAALMAAQMAMGAMRKIQGPRLENTKVTVAEYGTPIPRFWGIRKFECPMPHAEEITVRRKKSKTKGGKYSEDRGYGTWMSLICDHEIDAVTRIWFDDKLVYQATSAGPVSAGSFLSGLSGGGVHLGSNMRIYLGTETQLPDPRYESWAEDRYGADSAPAYRGAAYVFFEDIPLANFGNRIPNVTVEAVSNKTDVFPVEITASVVGTNDDACFSPDGSRMLVTNQGDLWEMWDTATRTLLLSGTHGFIYTGRSVIDNDGRIYTASVTNFYVSSSDFQTTTALSNPEGVDGDHAFNCAGVICFTPWFSSRTYALHVASGVVVKTTVGYDPRHYFADLDDNVWAIGAGTNSIKMNCIVGAAAGTSYTISTSSSASPRGVVNADGHAVLFQGAVATKVNLATGATLDTGAVSSGHTYHNFAPLLAGAHTIWINQYEYSLQTLDLIRSVTTANWGYPARTPAIYVPVCHALIISDGEPDNDMNWLFLDRVSNAGVTLQTVVNDVSGWCGVSGATTSALTQTVLGYSISQGTGKDMLLPLLDIHDVDPRPHDDGLEFKVRGSSSGGTLLTTDFARDGDAPRYSVSVQQDTDLPRRVTVNFADSAADQQVNTAISQRPLDAVDSQRDETIDLSTYVATTDDAQQLSDRRHRRLWNERELTKLSLTAKSLALEPGDVRTLSLDGSERIARLDKMTLKGSTIDCEWIRDHPTLHNLNGATGAELEGRNPETIYIPSQTKGFILDSALIQDADNDANPIFYYLAGAYGGTWPGAGVWRGDDGSYDEQIAFVEADAKATWGYLTGALATANPNLWDRGNIVEAHVFGTLTSVTEAAIDAAPTLNLAAVGVNGRWEYVNFTTATLTGTSGAANVYNISGFKRGRRGTEAFVDDHAAGDSLVLLNMAASLERGLDEIGNDFAIKAQTVGRDVDAAPAIDLTYAAECLKPYAPAFIKGAKDPSTGDWAFTWDRRTRIGGSWNGSTIPLSEDSEQYELVIMNGATEVRSITATSKTATWTSAQQTTDFGSGQSSAVINLYQTSAQVGRGHAAAATF